MPFAIHCPACGEEVEVDDPHRGWRVHCPVCGSEFQAGASAPAEPTPPPPGPGPRRQRHLSDDDWYEEDRYLRRRAMFEVSGPATALKVLGWLGVVCAGLCGVIWLGILLWVIDDPKAAQQMNKTEEEIYAEASIYIAQGAIGFVTSIVVLYGAIKMGRLESHGWSIASAVLAMLPCISPCCFLGIPFGIWALVVLNRLDVREAFDH